MFTTKKEENLPPRDRGYLEILPNFMAAVKKDFKIFVDPHLSPTFLEINQGKYNLLNRATSAQNHAALVALFQSFDLTKRATGVIDNAIGTTIANENELAILLHGLTNSLQGSSGDRELIEKSFRKFPVLIYARMIELTVVT